MCRYAVPYKQHYACFSCRKTYKRRLLSDIDRDKTNSNNPEEVVSKCPECAQPMASMGLDFEAPKKKEIKAWKHLENLYQVGIAFHSCGCSGPGYVPCDMQEALQQFEETKKGYIEHRRFWLNYKHPEKKRTDSEMQKEQNKNAYFYCKLPYKFSKGKRHNLKFNIEEAIKYWSENITKIDNHINYINTIKPQ